MIEGKPERSSARRFPAGFVGALALILGCEIFIERNALDYQGGSHWAYRVASRVARSESKENQILCFGDSLLKLGVAPKVMESVSQLRAYNFAQTGGQAPGSYFLLKHALDSGARPQAIVVDFFPKLLAESHQFNEENWPFFASFSDGIDLASVTNDPDTLARLAVRQVLPSARSRTSLRFHLLSSLRPSLVSIKLEVLKSIRNWKVNRGAEIVANRPGFFENLDSWELGYFSSVSCSKINQVYVDKFLDLADRYQIPVYWLLPPYHPLMQSRCERSGFDYRHGSMVLEFQARHRNLFVLDARRSSYPPDVFFDLHHLGRPGSSVLSADLALCLQDHLRDPRSRLTWTKLPDYRDRPVPGLEDVNQSRMVVWKELQAKSAKSRLR